MKVQEVMTKGLYTVQPDGTVAEMKEFMASLSVHALPIVDPDGGVVGIVTSSDLEPDLSQDTLAADLMSDQVHEIDGQADAREAAQMMRDRSVHHLVVMEDGRAIGMLSAFDLLRVIAGEVAPEGESLPEG